MTYVGYHAMLKIINSICHKWHNGVTNITKKSINERITYAGGLGGRLLARRPDINAKTKEMAKSMLYAA